MRKQDYYEPSIGCDERAAPQQKGQKAQKKAVRQPR